jgi:hypothetical protein
MTRTACITLCLVAFGLIAAVAFGADKYAIQPITISSNVPVKVTIAGEQTVNAPTYLTSAGEWKKLTVDKQGDTVSFSQPQDALAATVILLNKPDWLQLPDADAPVVDAISVAGEAVEASAQLNLGKLVDTPDNIFVTLSDAKNPIATSRVRVSVDGREPSAFGGEVKLSPSNDGKHLDVSIAPGKLDEAKHVVLLSAADASPSFNSLLIEIAFSTAPLLLNGDFEMADPKGNPLHWSCSTWSSDKDTKAELKVVDGGRSGKALMMNGIAGSLNLVCGQAVDFVPGNTYVLSGYYKTDENRGYASLIGKNKDTGKQDQYTSMPGLKKADEWTPFSFEFTAKQDNTEFMLYLRSGSAGKVYFDDVKAKLKP